MVGDTEHLADELETMYSKADVDAMTDEEKDYHYFRLHDYDQNNMLDGQEILKAVQHIIEEEDMQFQVNTTPAQFMGTAVPIQFL